MRSRPTRELLTQVAQQIAIAVENGLAYREIAELKEKLNEEKRTSSVKSAASTTSKRSSATASPLKNVLTQVEIVSPTDSTVLIQVKQARQRAHRPRDS